MDAAAKPLIDFEKARVLRDPSATAEQVKAAAECALELERREAEKDRSFLLADPEFAKMVAEAEAESKADGRVGKRPSEPPLTFSCTRQKPVCKQNARILATREAIAAVRTPDPATQRKPGDA